MNKSIPTIVLCICTYRRPDGLRKLLDSLPELDAGDGQRYADQLQIVVADNDAAREGLAVCELLPATYPFKLHTVSATEPGISAARNAATSAALALKPDLIAFLDDDEWPEPQWLAELIRIQTRCNADVVGGPTRPVFPANTPQDLLNNPYYGADMGLPDATGCTLQAGGNFLIRADVIEPLAPDFFHPAFAHSGGEDLAFFLQLQQLNRSMFWAANAIVHEPVPEARLHDGWMRSRIVNIHNARVRVMQLLQPELKHSIVRCLKTVVLGIVAGALSAVAWVSPALTEKARLLRWKFSGKLSAHLGRVTVRSETY